MKDLHISIQSLAIVTLTAISALSCFAADAVIIESRKADGTPNTPAWLEVSGKWDTSKNKSEVGFPSLAATNVSICTTNIPNPSIKISPTGLATNTTYRVEVTFGTSSTYVAAPDLVVKVTTAGLSSSTIPKTVPAFQGSNANAWTLLGTITPATDHPSLTFSYESGTLTKKSRWYADAMRFSPVSATR